MSDTNPPPTVIPKESDPKVSIVLLCMNHARFIEQALDSIRTQSYECTELVITDDGSSDESVSTIRSWLDRFGVEATTIFHEENQGLCRTLNEARAVINGEYVVIMSADDWMEPERIALQVQHFERSQGTLGVVYSDMYLVDEEGRRSPDTYHRGNPDQPEGWTLDTMIGRFFPTTPSAMIKRSFLELAGPYDETLPFEDYDMFLRLAALCEFGYIQVPLVSWRVHAASLSSTINLRAHTRQIFEKHLGRSDSTDYEIARQVGQVACRLYLEGRSGQETCEDLDLCMRYRPTNTERFVRSAAAAGVPGQWLSRAVSTRSALRSRFRHVRAAWRPPQRGKGLGNEATHRSLH